MAILSASVTVICETKTKNKQWYPSNFIVTPGQHSNNRQSISELESALLELLEALLLAAGLRHFQHVEPDGLAQGSALSDGDNVSDLHVPVHTRINC